MSDTVKYVLDESRIPKAWYNIMADLPVPPPAVLHPGTLQPVGPTTSRPLFPMALIQQEVTQEREVEIPEPVRDVYRQWRPCPLYRARRLEKALQTPARIYYKYEGVSPAAVTSRTRRAAGVLQQAGGREAPDYGNRRRPVGLVARVRGRAVRPRGAGVHGAGFVQPEALPSRADGNLRRTLRRLAVERDRVGTRDPRQGSEPSGQPGHRDIRAVEVAVQRDDTKYALGSVLNHVLLHQTVLGLEAMAQLEMANDYPDVIVGCTGGGSNFAGIAFPFWAHSCAAAGSYASWQSSRRRARASRAACMPTTSATPRT